MLLCSTDRTTL